MRKILAAIFMCLVLVGCANKGVDRTVLAQLREIFPDGYSDHAFRRVVGGYAVLAWDWIENELDWGKKTPDLTEIRTSAPLYLANLELLYHGAIYEWRQAKTVEERHRYAAAQRAILELIPVYKGLINYCATLDKTQLKDPYNAKPHLDNWTFYLPSR